MTEAEIAAKAAADAAAKATSEAAAAAALEADKSAYLTRLRNEAAAERAAADELKTKLAALETANTERERKELEANKEFEKMATYERERAEKAVKDMNDAIAKAKSDADAAISAAATRERRKALETLCATKGMRDLEDVDRLDMSKITFDDQNRPINADSVIEDLAKAKPHYFKVADGSQQQQRQTSQRPPAAATGSSDSATNAYDLSDEEFDKQYATLGKTRYARA